MVDTPKKAALGVCCLLLQNHRSLEGKHPGNGLLGSSEAFPCSNEIKESQDWLCVLNKCFAEVANGPQVGCWGINW